jgi:hypothetical protein
VDHAGLTHSLAGPDGDALGSLGGATGGAGARRRRHRGQQSSRVRLPARSRLEQLGTAVMATQPDAPADERVLGSAPPVPTATSRSPLRRLQVRGHALLVAPWSTATIRRNSWEDHTGSPPVAVAGKAVLLSLFACLPAMLPPTLAHSHTLVYLTYLTYTTTTTTPPSCPPPPPLWAAVGLSEHPGVPAGAPPRGVSGGPRQRRRRRPGGAWWAGCRGRHARPPAAAGGVARERQDGAAAGGGGLRGG